MRYLALDYGRRRTGVALSDEAGAWAFPHAMWEGCGRAKIIEQTVQLVRQHAVDAVLLGLPKTLDNDGAPQEMERHVLQLQSLLEAAFKAARLEITVQTWDERFSTALVLRQLREAGISQRAARHADNAGSTDARAAAAILQNYLDSIQNQQSESSPLSHV